MGNTLPKRKLSVGRTKGRMPVYFWWSEAFEKREGWYFPSRKAAYKWRDARYWKYAEHKVLDHFLATVPESMWYHEKKWWKSHRDHYNDLTLEMAIIEHVGERFDVGIPTSGDSNT